MQIIIGCLGHPSGTEIEVYPNGQHPSVEEIDIAVEKLKEYQKELHEIGNEEIERENLEWQQRQEKGIIESGKAAIDRGGYVYLIKSGGLYKIGKTKNKESRMKTYRTENPHIEIVAIDRVRDMDALEKNLLVEYKEKVVRGEWHELDEDDVNFIITILCTERIK